MDVRKLVSCVAALALAAGVACEERDPPRPEGKVEKSDRPTSGEASTVGECGSNDVQLALGEPDGATGALVFSVRVDPKEAPCRFTDQLVLTLAARHGAELEVKGNPAVVEFDGEVGNEAVSASWVWRNWCGKSTRFWYFVNGKRYADGQGFDTAARCDNPTAPSVLAPVRPWMRGVNSYGSIKSRGVPHVVYDCFHAALRPIRMTLACADNGFRAHALIWGEWTKHGAAASGRFEMNDCDPGCAGGTFHHRTGTIYLTERRYCLELDRYVFGDGWVVFHEPFEGRFRYAISPGCPS